VSRNALLTVPAGIEEEEPETLCSSPISVPLASDILACAGLTAVAPVTPEAEPRPIPARAVIVVSAGVAARRLLASSSAKAGDRGISIKTPPALISGMTRPPSAIWAPATCSVGI